MATDTKADKEPEPVGGMLSGEAFKPPAEPAPDPRANQYALALALRTPKPTSEGS